METETGMAPGCAICMLDREEIPEDELAMLPCGHSFCAHCVVSWSVLHCKCPLCNAVFSTILARKDPSGTPLRYGANEASDQDVELGWSEYEVDAMQCAKWVRITEMRSAHEDILSSIHLQNTVGDSWGRAAHESGYNNHMRSEQHEDELEEACFAEAGELWESSRRAMRQGSGSGGRNKSRSAHFNTSPVGSSDAIPQHQHWERIMNRSGASSSRTSSRKGKRNRAQVVI